ncbi:MAG TPA: TonB-dependent receptor [Flavisolibacter sp.]|nr:TonB-dependent receptor [Flavisolibacter sp.]
MRLRVLLTSFSFLFILALQAQSIRFSGRIVNDRNEPVAGASVRISGTSTGTTTSVDGTYALNLTPGNKYTIEVSAIGYVAKSISDIDVTAGGVNELNIVLETASKTQEGVVVRATSRRQESTNALLNFQRNNSAVSSGLAADFIRRTPDRNTSEVLKRVSGASIQDNKFVVIRGLSDRYNSAYINNAQFPSTEPDKKAFSFDVIPSALIDNIIINKTATPELTGEFAGGLVQITTKDVPAKDILSVGVSFGFNTNSTFKDFASNRRNSTDWLGFDDGTRSIPSGFPTNRQGYSSKNLATQAGLSRLFSSDVYNQESSRAAPIQTYNLIYGIGRKLKNDATFGLVSGIIYRKGDLLYSVGRQFGERDISTINRSFTDEQNRYAVNLGGMLNLSYAKGKTRVSFKNLFNQNYEDNYYTRTGIDNDRQTDVQFYSSYVNQRSLYTSQLELDRQLTSKGIRVRLNGNFAYNWKTQPDLRTVSYFKSLGSNEEFKLSYDETNRFFSDLKEFGYGGGGQLIVPFKLGKEAQTMKAGGSTLIRIRDFKSRNFRYVPASAEAELLRSLPFDQIFRPENISENGFVLDETTQNEDKYFGVSVLNAGYLMFDNKISSSLRVVWGARAENFQQVLISRRSDLQRIVLDNEKWDILPSVNFVYSLNPKNNIRLSASQTVARPEFREIAPFSFFDFEQNYAVSGDTTLKRSKIFNADIRYEWYPRAGESISFGVFYKNFNDPIELRARNRNPSRYSFQNADEATTYGFELEARKGLEFLGTAFSNFNLFANLTYIQSEVKLGGTTSGGQAVNFDRPLQGQSPYLINAGLQYNSDKGGLSGTLLYNRIGQRLTLVGDPVLEVYDIYERPRDQVDLQIAKRILNNRGELKLNLSDLFNQQYYFYENIDDKKAFKSSSDRRFSAYTPGRTFTLGFTYDFIK